MESVITDIQRFSLSDGAGIRTSIFFKGCNIRCEWCHNPETISRNPQLIFYRTKCIGCGSCFSACPKNAHRLENGSHIIDRNLCMNCGKCASVCYAEALVMCGRRMTVAEIMSEVRQDIQYYRDSGGGVTLSGGEVLCQREFAAELVKACHAEKINVAVETNLSLPFDEIKDFLSSVDYIMCDIKIFDSGIHKKYTGIENTEILRNIRLLDSLCVPFTVRTPLIPGVTDSNKNISAIAKYIVNLKNLQSYELLNFNPLGAEKYKGLDKINRFLKAGPLDKDRLDELEELVQNIGVKVKIV